jgi:DNA polymerase III epsilon subunit family exonuclease
LATSIEKSLFAIVDVETTGGKPSQSKITDIGIIITDGSNIIEEFSCLLNPEKPIDPFVIKLTNITNEMVSNQPIFKDCAVRINNLLKDCIFVAHNADFDFQMVRKEFLEIGIPFQVSKICTVKLTKSIFPNLSSYSLKNVCEYFDITLENAHRAYQDALATAHLFHHLFAQKHHNFLMEEVKKQNYEVNIPSHWEYIHEDILNTKSGVLIFKDQLESVLIIEYASNIKKSLYKLLDQNLIYPHIIEEIKKMEILSFDHEIKAELFALDLIQKASPKYTKRFKDINYQAVLTIEPTEKELYHFKIVTKTEIELYHFPYVFCTSKKMADKLKKRLIQSADLHFVYHYKTNLNGSEVDFEQKKNHYNLQMQKVFNLFCCPINDGYYIFSNYNGLVEGVKIKNFYIHSWIKGQLNGKTIHNEEEILTFDINPKFTKKFLNIINKVSYKIITNQNKPNETH